MATRDLATFSLGMWPDDARGRAWAEDLAAPAPEQPVAGLALALEHPVLSSLFGCVPLGPPG